MYVHLVQTNEPAVSFFKRMFFALHTVHFCVSQFYLQSHTHKHTQKYTQYLHTQTYIFTQTQTFGAKFGPRRFHHNVPYFHVFSFQVRLGKLGVKGALQGLVSRKDKALKRQRSLKGLEIRKNIRWRSGEIDQVPKFIIAGCQHFLCLEFPCKCNKLITLVDGVGQLEHDKPWIL